MSDRRDLPILSEIVHSTNLNFRTKYLLRLLTFKFSTKVFQGGYLRNVLRNTYELPTNFKEIVFRTTLEQIINKILVNVLSETSQNFHNCSQIFGASYKILKNCLKILGSFLNISQEYLKNC
jgi:hypothetical protein